MDFIIGLPISINWKGEKYVYKNSILQAIIDILVFAKIIIDIIVRYYGLFDLIITN